MPLCFQNLHIINTDQKVQCVNRYECMYKNKIGLVKFHFRWRFSLLQPTTGAHFAKHFCFIRIDRSAGMFRAAGRYRELRLRLRWHYILSGMLKSFREDTTCCIDMFTHLPLVPHICVGELSQHWFRWWPVVYLALCHYLNQWWFIVNWTLRDTLQWNFNRNSYISIQKNAFAMSSAKWLSSCLGLHVLRNGIHTLTWQV